MARIIDRVTGFRVERFVMRAAVIAIPVHREVRESGVIVERAIRAAGVHSRPEVSEASIGNGAAYLIRRFPLRGEYLDDSSGGVAVERGKRAAQNLHSLRGVQIELRHLALTVGT